MSTQAHDQRIGQLSPAKRALLEQWRKAHAAPTPTGSPIPQRRAGNVAPLSFAQQRLWFLDQLEPNNPFYNVAAAVRMTGPLDADVLEQSLHASIARHDALRTTFRATDGQPEQVVHSRIDWKLARIELQAADVDDGDQELHRLAEEEALRPFDLVTGPLMRGTLLRIAEREHVLLLTMHHIVCDGWSMGVLRQEIAQNYTTLLQGRTARLPSLPIQYADFAAWQREQLVGDAVERLQEYWSQQLAHLPGPLELPLDFRRPAEQTFRGDVRRRRIDAQLQTDLRRITSDEDVTLFMVLMAAFQVLLARYSGQRDLCIGTPIANRSRQELEPLVGFFANTLVLRGDVSANPTLRQLLAQVRRTTLDAYAHQDLPFERLVEHLQPPRDVSRTPLFQVMFVLQNIPLRAQEIAGLRVTEVSFDHAPVSTFDLTLNVDEQPQRLDLSLVFNPDLFLPATIDRWLESYEVLLRELVADRDQRVLEVCLLPADQLRRQLVEWNDTRSPLPTEQRIHELIAAQARRTPDAPAVLCEGESLSYRQLDERSDRLAQTLVRRDIGPDVPVGICIDRSPHMIVGILGILKAGGAYVPLDPFYPQARLETMIRDAGLRLILTTTNIAGRLPPHNCQLLRLDVDSELTDERLPPAAVAGAGADNLAYIIFTSGSTGEPKGAEVEHRGLVNHALDIARRLELGPGDRVLQYLSLSFDAAAEEVFPTLISGAALHLHPTPSELSGRVLLDWSREQHVNVLHVPPPVWLSLLEELAIEPSQSSHSAKHLKALMTGGDNVRLDDVARWQTLTGGKTKFLMAYGVTEATITSTLYEADEPLAMTPSGRLPIGRPIANTWVYVLDAFLRPVPIGAPGELYVGGVGVARGYRDRPALTSERFVADPHLDELPDHQDRRMYRTGDLVRYLHDGNLEFLGRVDQQVKVNGYRIEPGEIEAVLRQHPEVCEAVLISRSDTLGEHRLAAYVACNRDTTVSEGDLRSFLSERLPRHMLPASMMVLDRLPRLPNEKIDLRSLPPPCWTRGQPERDYVAPRNEMEANLAEIWAGVLGADRIGVCDNFFELGGDSIRGIQMIARAGAAGMRFTPKQLFQHQTIAELSLVVDTADRVRAEQGPVIGPGPLSPIQHEFFDLKLTDPQHFNQSVMLTVRPGVTLEIVDAAAQHLLEHHDALRMRYVRAPDGTWRQEGMPPEGVVGDGLPSEAGTVVERVDLSSLRDVDVPLADKQVLATDREGSITRSASTRQTAAIEQAAAKAQAGLRLDTGPLVRTIYFNLGRDIPARLLIIIHHLVVDAVSWPILLEDLSTACEQIVRGEEPSLAPKTTSFAEWSRRLALLADAPTLRRELDYWTSPALSAAMQTEIPYDCHTGENLVASTETVCMSLDTNVTRKWLVDSQAAYRTRPHELLITALAETLCGHLQGGVVGIELEGHGREDICDDVDLSRTVGWFTSLYPIALQRPAAAQSGDWIKSVKEQLRSVPNGGIGYGALRWLASDENVCRRLATLARPAVSFNYLGQFDHVLPGEGPFALAQEATGPDRSPRGIRPHPWEIIAHVRDGQLHVEWRFSSNLHRRETIERLANEFLAALRRLVDHCLSPDAGGATPADFPLAGIDQCDMDRLAALLGDSDAIAVDDRPK